MQENQDQQQAMRSLIRKEILKFSVLFGVVGLLLTFLMGYPKGNILSVIKPLHGQTAVKAVVFVIGAACPAGFQDATTAGYSEMENSRFPLMVADTNGNDSANFTWNGANDPLLAGVSGGNPVMVESQMPSHSHSTYVGARHGDGDGGTWFWSTHDAGGWAGTDSRGGDMPYWPRYYKLKPCIWNLN